MKRVRASTLLRKLADALGLAELARRSGYSKATIQRAASSGKLSEPLREEIRAVEERRVAARARARKKELAKTRIPAELETDPKALAKALRVTERTARKWISVGGAPTEALDAAMQLADTGRAYPEPEHGRREGLSDEERGKIERAMTRMVEATRQGKASPDLEDEFLAWKKEKPKERKKVSQLTWEIQRAARAWRRTKIPIRRKVAANVWRELISDIGKKLDLPEWGVFSVPRFVKS